MAVNEIAIPLVLATGRASTALQRMNPGTLGAFLRCLGYARWSEGRIRGAGAWTDRSWKRKVGISLAAACSLTKRGLLRVDGDDLICRLDDLTARYL